MNNETNEVSAVVERPEWTWPVFAGVRSIGTKKIVLIDRIVVLKNRKIWLLPLRNAKCHMHTRPRFILATFTQPSSSILTSRSTPELLRNPLNPVPTVQQVQRLGSMTALSGF
jgi:hypothetical protein